MLLCQSTNEPIIIGKVWRIQAIRQKVFRKSPQHVNLHEYIAFSGTSSTSKSQDTVLAPEYLGKALPGLPSRQRRATNLSNRVSASGRQGTQQLLAVGHEVLRLVRTRQLLEELERELPTQDALPSSSLDYR